MTVPQQIIGVDVAKNWIDVFHLASGKAEHIAKSKRAFARFVPCARDSLVVLEASGGCERPLTDALVRAGVDDVRVDPRRARAFARATGKLARTDRVDAEILARMGRALELKPTAPVDAQRALLAELVARRDDLVAAIVAETSRASMARDPWIRKDSAKLIKELRKHRAAVEKRIADHIAACESLAHESRRLTSVPGIGPALPAVPMARLPEPGRLDRRRIAALAGLAPHAADSGRSRGKRRIRGGRADVRRSLYLAGFVASRHDPAIKAFRARLQTAGKPFKVVITACARKLLTILDAMARNDQHHRRIQA